MKNKETQKTPQAMILVDLKFLNGAIEEVYDFYPDFESEKLELEKLIVAIMEQTGIQSGYRVTARFLSWEEGKLFRNCAIPRIQELEGKPITNEAGAVEIVTNCLDGRHSLGLTNAFEETLSGVDTQGREQNYTKVVIVSDWNYMRHAVQEEAMEQGTELILGRLENDRTICYPAAPWFDIEYLIMDCLGIDLTIIPLPHYYFDPFGPLGPEPPDEELEAWRQEYLEERRLAGEEVEDDEEWEFNTDPDYDPGDVPF